MREFMNKKAKDMTVGETIKYTGLMTGVGIVLSLLLYGATYAALKIKGEI